MSGDGARFGERRIEFDGGIKGETIEIATANPLNYHQVVSASRSLPKATIDGQLFRPRGQGRLPCIVIVPGSLGVADSHVAHARTLTQLGFAAFVVDPFGARNVTSTVADQTQYSFAASAYDVLATYRTLAARDDIDAGRIGAQGHSRGGSAVLTAATRRFADAVIGPSRGLRAVYAAYPWCGHQFLDPGVGATIVRCVIGDRDEWCLPQQVQGHVQAIRLAGGDASLEIFPAAHHSFDRETSIELIKDASVSPGAPTVYLSSEGAFVHPLSGESDARLVDRDLMVYALKAGYGRTGARIGSQPGQAEAFRKDMERFWIGALSEAPAVR